MATENIDFAPDEVNIKVPRGNAWSMEVTVEGVNLTGKTLSGYIRESPRQAEDDYATLVITAVDLVNGIIQVGQANAQQAGEYYVNMKDGVSQPRTILYGTIGLKEIGQK